MAALRAETERVAAARPGTRNDTLNRAAFSLGQLVAAGLLPPIPVITGLIGAAMHAGLSEAEARAPSVPAWRAVRASRAPGSRPDARSSVPCRAPRGRSLAPRIVVVSQ